MPRLIDANKIGERSKQLMERGCSLIEYAASIVNEIAEAPTVDAVEVVRCRECEHWRRTDDVNDDIGYCTNPEGLDDYAKPTDFCSYGERKDGDG